MAGEWFHDIPDSWEILRLDEVATIIDSLHKTPVYTGSGYPMVRVTDVKGGFLDLSQTFSVTEDVFEEFTRRHVPQQGDIVFSRVGTYGNVSYVATDSPFCLGQNTALIHPKIDGRFLHLYLQSPPSREQIEQSVVGSTQKTISLKSIGALQVPVPPKQELQAISHILGTLDDKIELNRRMNETLEAMARALFKSWFVDFDPVRAKAEGRDPGLPKAIADIFPDCFEGSELGEIPAGWEVHSLADVTGFLGGYAFKSKDWSEHGVPVVKIGSVKPGIVDLSAVSFVSKQVAEVAKRFRLSPGDLLIGMTGYVGEVGLVPLTDNPPLLNQRVGEFVLETAGTSAMAYLYCLTRRSEFKDQVETKSHGTAQANVSAEGILSIPIVVPSKALRDEFNRLGQPILDGILVNHAASCTIAALRDTLLPKLISGELQVKDAERFFERTV